MTPHDMKQGTVGDLAPCLWRIERGRKMSRALRMDENISPDNYAGPLLDAVSLFEHLNIGYALVGGVAAMVYGRARFTEDVDFVAAEGHRRLLEQHAQTMRQYCFDPKSTWKLYHDSGLEIDIWKDDYADDIIARARIATLAGRSVRVADPHDLIAMKLRAGRLQDDYDISQILMNTAIEDDVIRARTSPQQFEHFVTVKQRTQAES